MEQGVSAARDVGLVVSYFVMGLAQGDEILYCIGPAPGLWNFMVDVRPGVVPAMGYLALSPVSKVYGVFHPWHLPQDGSFGSLHRVLMTQVLVQKHLDSLFHGGHSSLFSRN